MLADSVHRHHITQTHLASQTHLALSDVSKDVWVKHSIPAVWPLVLGVCTGAWVRWQTKLFLLSQSCKPAFSACDSYELNPEKPCRPLMNS